ncbi:glycosyltransferase, partial [Vibrio rarus]
SNLDKTNLVMIESKVSPLFVVIHASVEEELKRHARMGPIKYLKKLRTKKVLNGQNLVTVSKGIESEIINKKRIKPKTINTIYNPFDIEKIRSLSNKENSDIPTFDYLIHVGRFVAQKRHDVLFRSITKMKNNLPIVFLSHKPEAIMKMARKFGVEDRVIAPDFQLNPYPWIKRAKGLILSSDFEGLPTVLIEALICKTPVVSTRCPHGPIEILTGDLERFLVSTGDYKNLARVTDEMLQEYPNMNNLDILERVQSESVAMKYLRLLHEN